MVKDDAEPEADVNVARGLADRLGDGDEAWPRGHWLVDSKLFVEFAPSRVRGMLAWFDVAARRKPQFGVDVVDQQDLAAVRV